MEGKSWEADFTLRIMRRRNRSHALVLYLCLQLTVTDCLDTLVT